MFPLKQLQEYCARFFFEDYFQCRDHFREIIKNIPQLSHQVFNNHVVEKEYDCDVCLLGKLDANRIIVLISGTHGIEGYCGSAIQRYLLSEQADALLTNRDHAFLFIHALNPWGMAWYRRCDENGVDVNRNFIDFKNPPVLQSEYSFIRELLLTQNESIRQAKIDQLILKWGQTRFDELLSGGQYQYESVPFFGGKTKSFSRTVIEQVIDSFALAEKELVVIDLHTGLGPWTFGELISDHPTQSFANRYAKKIFGHAVSVTEAGESFSVEKKGLLDFAWHPYMNTKGCFLTLEFGTLGSNSLFQTLIEENLIWIDACDNKYQSLNFEKRKKMMLNHFFPKDVFWQQAVIFRAEQVLHKCLEYFNEQE